MSRALERAYDLIARVGEKIGMEKVSQFRMEQETVADNALVTDGAGGFKLVPTSNFGGGDVGAILPEPPLGTNDALTCDPAGVIRWGGQVSAGEF